MKLQRPHAVTQHVFLVDALDRNGPPARREVRIEHREPIGRKRARRRREQHVLVEVGVVPMGHQRRSLRDVGPQAARVIEMVMGVDDVAYELVRRNLANRLQHRERSLLVERRLDHRDVVAELHRDAVMRAAADEPDALGHLLGVGAHRRRRGLTDVVGHRHRRNRHVRLDVRHPDFHRVVRGIEDRVALMHVDGRRKLHAAEILVIEMADLVQHVAVHRIGNPRGRELDKVLIVDGADDLVLAKRRERDQIRPPAVFGQAGIGRPHDGRGHHTHVFAGHRRLQKAVRRQDDLELPELVVRHDLQIRPPRESGFLTLHVPGIAAADDLHHALVAVERRAAAPHRVVPPPPREVLPRHVRVVVDRARIGGHLEPRPVLLQVEALAHQRVPARRRVLDRLHAVEPHRRRRRLQDRSRVLRRGGHPRQSKQHYKHTQA